MSTNLVSFLLLKKFRGGIKLDDFVNEVDAFRLVLKLNKKRVGFTGTSKNVIMHAVSVNFRKNRKYQYLLSGEKYFSTYYR